MNRRPDSPAAIVEDRRKSCSQTELAGKAPLVAVRNAGARLRRSVAMLAASSSACWFPPLPSPPPSRWYRTRGRRRLRRRRAGTAHSVRVVVTGGMAAWQVTLIALGAALLAAVAAVLLYRVLAVRKAASAATG